MDQETAENLIDALGASSGIVAVVGAGGKKSTLYRLLEAHQRLGTARIALTSTVQIAPAAKALEVENVIVAGDIDAAVSATNGRNGAWLIAGPSEKPGRFSGLHEKCIPSLHRQGAFDITMVKADGARMRMIKAPADNEPALPDGVTTILPLVSARVFGRPLTEKLAHRPERLTRIIDADLGAALTPLHIARLLSSPDGALKRVGTAEVVPVINMVDGPEHLVHAEEAAAQALAMTDRFKRVVLACMAGPSPLIDVIRG